MTGLPLILAFIVAIVLMIVMISKFKIHPFISIMLISVVLGIIAGIPIVDQTLEDGTKVSGLASVIGAGFSGTFSSIGIVIILGALIGSILDLSKLDSGAVHMEVTMNDVREILYDAAGIILPEADKRGIQVNIEAAEPLFMECDERMIFSTFSNILTNALRYAEREISVRIEKQDKIIIRFINDGVPISDEEIAHIFDRFYKGDKGQTGLGVALAQEYVNLHGGEISAAARDNRTEFVIII